MRLVFVFKIFLICFITPAFADPKFYGSWLDAGTGLQLDILDGFKPNAGPALIIDEEGKISSSYWKVEDENFEITVNWQSYEASIGIDGSLILTPSYGKPVNYKPILTNDESASVSLKNDEIAFVSKLQDFVWSISDESTTATFKTTFGTDTGVVEILDGKNLKDLESWSVSSGILKLSSSVIVESRITNKYFVGLNQYDEFIIYKSIRPSDKQVTTDVELQRDKFFDGLLTGEWERKTWGDTIVHKFRPIYGELAGKRFSIIDNRLYSDRSWEYSPATGALEVGGSEYIGALIVNETLALIDESGDQTFYNRLKNGNIKRYTLGDVKTVSLSENSLQKVKEMLAPQFQRDDYFYSFEFKKDGRTGFTHKWRSTPFNITGETFETDLIGESEKLFQVEDFVVFDDRATFKMDTSESRLKPKSDDEVATDVGKQMSLKTSAQTKTVKVRMLTTSGETIDVALPVNNLSEITSISILTE